MELMFYNENYQMGLVMTYEFMINNAGNVDKYYIVRPFFSSRYDLDYHRISQFAKVILFIIDLIYFLGLIWLTYTVIKRIYEIITVWVRFKTFKIYAIDVINIAIAVLSIMCLVYRTILCKYFIQH